jgi:hypothetical protein
VELFLFFGVSVTSLTKKHPGSKTEISECCRSGSHKRQTKTPRKKTRTASDKKESLSLLLLYYLMVLYAASDRIDQHAHCLRGVFCVRQIVFLPRIPRVVRIFFRVGIFVRATIPLRRLLTSLWSCRQGARQTLPRLQMMAPKLTVCIALL